MKKLCILFFMSVWLSGCVAAVIGGVGTTAYMASRQNFEFISSDLVKDLRKKVAFEMKNNKQNTSAVKVFQNNNKIYVVGMVKSGIVKERIENAVKQVIQGNFVNEIFISDVEYSAFESAFVQARIRKDLLFAKYVRSMQYDILAFDDKFFIVGKASNDQEKDGILNTISKIEYIENAVTYIL